MRYPLPISWHIQDWSDPRIRDYVFRVLPEFERVGFPFWIKGLDPPTEKPDYVTANVRVLGRIFEGRVYDVDTGHWGDMARGEEGAEHFYSLMRPIWLQHPWVTAWTIGNEPHPPDDHDFLRALNRFMVRLADLAHADGFKIAGPNLSVGWPDIGDAPLLGEGICKMDWLCLHEYSAPAMWTTEPYHVGRWLLTIEELAKAGYTNLPPVLMGEFGVDGNVTPVCRNVGWKTLCASPQEYAQQMRWAAEKYLDHLGAVEAAFIFTVAPYGWGWDDFLPTDELFKCVGDEVIAGYEVDEQPIPVPPPAFDIIDVVDELPVHPDKEYASRYYSDIHTIVIHHAGYSYPANATYDQVRGHLDVIANYHINTKDWPGIAYHFVVDGMGRVWQTNDIDTLSYHAGVANSYSVGICMLGAFHLDTVPTDAQLQAVNCLCQWLEEEIGAVLDIVPHKAIIATACPGKWNLWKDKILIAADGCFEDEPENGGEESMDIQVVDQLGNVLDMTWEEVHNKYGLEIIRAGVPAGEKVWRVRRLIWDKSPDTNYRTYCRDEHGAPMSGITTFLGATPGDYTLNLPPDAAPRLSETLTSQPVDGSGNIYPNVALKHPTYKTNADGYMQHSLGSGSNTVPPRPVYQWAWVMPGDYKWYSDWIHGVGGMFVDEESGVEHQMWWVEFWLQEAGGEEPGPTPLPEDAEFEAVVPEIEITFTVKVPSFTVPVVPVEK